MVFMVMVMLMPVCWGSQGHTGGGRGAVVHLPLSLGVLCLATGLSRGGAAGVLSPGAEPPAALAPEQRGVAGPEVAGRCRGEVMVMVMTVDPGRP